MVTLSLNKWVCLFLEPHHHGSLSKVCFHGPLQNDIFVLIFRSNLLCVQYCKWCTTHTTHVGPFLVYVCPWAVCMVCHLYFECLITLLPSSPCLNVTILWTRLSLTTLYKITIPEPHCKIPLPPYPALFSLQHVLPPVILKNTCLLSLSLD